MTSRSTRAGGEKQQVVSNMASSANKDTVSPIPVDAGIPQWAKDMMSEIKKANEGITKYREETKTDIARCKEEIEKGRKETKVEMEKWTKSLEEITKAQFELLHGEVKLIGDKTSSLANRMVERKKEVDETLNEQSDAITDMGTRLKEMEKEIREGAEAGKRP